MVAINNDALLSNVANREDKPAEELTIRMRFRSRVNNNNKKKKKKKKNYNYTHRLTN